MTATAISLGFFDPAQELHGILRSGVAVLFEGTAARTLDEPPELSASGPGYRAVAGEGLELEFEPVAEEAELGGGAARVARVRGHVLGRKVECLGTAGETRTPPAWAELDAVRLVSAVFDEEHAVLAAAQRPHGAKGHGQELVTAHLLSGGQMLAVEDGRISTVYDAQGRQRSVGLELWLPGEDFPRRASGSVRAGLSLALEGLRVDAGLVAWRMEGRDGAGAYEITVRAEPGEAA
ncbi:MAG TPA: hypothetical protein VHF45_05360 [Thermoleophilaceae bacterium]|nr:hypothetical protein [Thermoleophilaceae bacterium]